MTRLAVVLTEGFADWECAHLMSAARGELGVEVVTATPGADTVTSMGGLQVAQHRAMEELSPDDFDAVVFCGGTIWQGDTAPQIGQVVTDFADNGRVVGAICDAVIALAGTGRLNAVRHTGNHPDFFNTVAGYAGQAHYIDMPGAVVDGGLVTAGGDAPLSFMVEVLSALGYPRDHLEQYRGIMGAEHSVRSPA